MIHKKKIFPLILCLFSFLLFFNNSSVKGQEIVDGVPRITVFDPTHPFPGSSLKIYGQNFGNSGQICLRYPNDSEFCHNSEGIGAAGYRMSWSPFEIYLLGGSIENTFITPDFANPNNTQYLLQIKVFNGTYWSSYADIMIRNYFLESKDYNFSVNRPLTLTGFGLNYFDVLEINTNWLGFSTGWAGIDKSEIILRGGVWNNHEIVIPNGEVLFSGPPFNYLSELTLQQYIFPLRLGKLNWTTTNNVTIAYYNDSAPTSEPTSSPTEPTPEPTSSLMDLQYDINNDQMVNNYDMEYVVRCYLPQGSAAGDCLKSDLNHDGRVNAIDYSLIITAVENED